MYSLLEHAKCLDMLRDPAVTVAVSEIASEGRPRHEVTKDIRLKERAREYLAKKYAREGGASAEDLLTCLYSIGDNASYLRFNRDPIDRCAGRPASKPWIDCADDVCTLRSMIGYLQEFFDPRDPGPDRAFSLAIALGASGARLSHSHERQYTYVLQSLTLWREVAHDMFKLWHMAEDDLLREGSAYRLTDTGQGLNRVQQAPATSRAIHALLGRCQARLGTWVGSSVVHLGDHNVPNALMFIDKYTQVPRILAPVVLCIEQIDILVCDPGLAAYVNGTFGSAERCERRLPCAAGRAAAGWHALTHGGRRATQAEAHHPGRLFPARLRRLRRRQLLRRGALCLTGGMMCGVQQALTRGAAAFTVQGSCIDGRLTSAWNWCSQIEKKARAHARC